MLANAPSLMPKIAFVKLDEFMSELEGIDKPIRGGVAVYGSAAAYALVWEFGALKNVGPKTVMGANGRIFSKQAPEGYVGIHQDDLFDIVVAELKNATIVGRTPSETKLRLEIISDNISQKWARLISDSAPADTGDLRAQIQYVESGDSILDLSSSSGDEGSVSFSF
jgi:hypothetical protein